MRAGDGNVENSVSAAARLAGWAEPTPEFGHGVYRITSGVQEHKHAYYYLCPWSPDGRWLLLMRYDRENPEAEISVMDTANGETSLVGATTKWNSHSAAFQQWTTDGKILYVTGRADEMDIITVFPDGSGERRFSSVAIDDQVCISPDGRWLYSASMLGELFPDDKIGPRSDKGLIRMNLETGETQLLLSIEKALAVTPDPKAIAFLHLYIKRIIPHPQLPRLLFNLTNTFWDIDGKEPSIRFILSVDLDGSAPAFVGGIVHHPCWHPTEDCVVANVRDGDGMMRFGLLRSERSESPEYVPAAKGSGHPTFSPDGRWLCTDGAGPNGDKIVLCDPPTGQVTVIAEPHSVSAGYASFKALRERKSGETVINTLTRAASKTGRTWQTHAHPVWSRDGSAILFNTDIGQGSQLYFVDVTKAMLQRDRIE